MIQANVRYLLQNIEILFTFFGLLTSTTKFEVVNGPPVIIGEPGITTPIILY